MKRAPLAFLIVLCLYMWGCSMPAVATYKQLESFTKEERKSKIGLDRKSKKLFFKDFRKNEMYQEDVAALKEEVERYVSSHPELSDSAKNNLRELKVVEGFTRQEVELLLGAPDKITKLGRGANYNASEEWIYKINKIRAFTVFIFPVFFVHEGYYLYFRDDILAGIERHYLKQIVEQSAGPGVFQKKE